MHNPRRQRPRGHGGHHGGGNRRSSSNANNGGFYNRNQTFDSNGPEVRIRGTASQVHEKYVALARDASAAGDHIRAENLLQHAEHYSRIMATIQEAWNAQQEQPRVDSYAQPQPQSQQPDSVEGLPARYTRPVIDAGAPQPTEGGTPVVVSGTYPADDEASRAAS